MTQPKAIVVTGVSRGLGCALLERFLEAGHIVAGCARSAAGIEALRERFGTDPHLDVVDVADAGAVESFAARVVEQHGAPDLIVNNAALINEPAPLWEVAAPEFDQLLAVNVSGVANVVRAFVPAMIDQGRGVIVNLSSGWGRSTSPEVGPYCTTKWAIEGFSRALAQELPSGLACVALNPGIINTDMLRTCWAESAAAYEDAETWSQRAAPFLLRLGAHDNGGVLAAP